MKIAMNKIIVKLWLKYLIGVVLGLAVFFVFKFNTSRSVDTLTFITEIAIRIGRYCVVPLVCFTGAVAFFELIQSKLIFKTVIWTAIVSVASSLILSIIGVVAILIVKLPRIPITVERATDTVSLGITDMIRSLFPYSSIETLLNGNFLFAPFLFALCIGAAFASDENTFRHLITLCDSLSKLFYTIGKVVTEIMSICMITIMCAWTVQFRGVLGSGVFTPLIIMLTVVLLVVAAIVYPLIIYLVCHEPNPYRVLYASIAPLIVAFFSGDANLTLPVAQRHTNKSLGIRRRTNGFVTPLISIFARGGTSLIIAVSFIVIRRSYSDLSIPFRDIIWLLLISFLFSFVTGGMSKGGTFLALSVLCTMYARGFEAGFLLLAPLAPILSSFATAFNVLTIMFGTYIVALKTRTAVRHSTAHFV